MANAVGGRRPPDTATPHPIEDKTHRPSRSVERLHRAREHEAEHNAMITDYPATLVIACKYHARLRW